MVEVETNAERTRGVTRIAVVVTNTQSTPQTVRLRSLLDGPVWPPRRDGVVDPRWNDGVWETTVRPDRSRGIGFASPAPPVDPAVEVVSSDRRVAVDDRTPETVLASLDDWRPTNEVLERDR